jgi:hypothetical protein
LSSSSAWNCSKSTTKCRTQSQTNIHTSVSSIPSRYEFRFSRKLEYLPRPTFQLLVRKKESIHEFLDCVLIVQHITYMKSKVAYERRVYIQSQMKNGDFCFLMIV